MSYAERRVSPDVEVWRGSGGPTLILPDGCLDLLLDGEELLVAGPDRTARRHEGTSDGTVWGARLHAGRGAALLGVPADELADRTVPLESLWPAAQVRELTERVHRDPGRELAAWAVADDVDPFGLRLRALLASGRSVAEAADALGWSPRQLQRRTRPVFGYGPQHLGRVLRLQRVIAAADAGDPWGSVAATAGYTDQAHLTRDVRDLTGLTPGALRRVRSVQDAA